jgi:hypothetical protein
MRRCFGLSPVSTVVFVAPVLTHHADIVKLTSSNEESVASVMRVPKLEPTSLKSLLGKAPKAPPLKIRRFAASSRQSLRFAAVVEVEQWRLPYHELMQLKPNITSETACTRTCVDVRLKRRNDQTGLLSGNAKESGGLRCADRLFIVGPPHIVLVRDLYIHSTYYCVLLHHYDRHGLDRPS